MTNSVEIDPIDNNPDAKQEEAMDTGDDDVEMADSVVSSNAVTVPAEDSGHVNGESNLASDLEDECRAEATFLFKIENVSKMRDQVLSSPCFVRNLPWKILAMPRSNQSTDKGSVRSLGFFLQCNAESESTSWSCNASADLRILRQTGSGETFSRRIQHLFYSKENDWGFSSFITWADMLDPSKGYIDNDSIILEVLVNADAPHGVCWDSKKHTGFVGLKNQGATCYMNSLLQTLYFTNKLRKAVYQMPTEKDDLSNSVALALQRVFYDLQFSEKPVGTKKLTRSFGWETLDSFMQHDVQELCRVLLDNIELKMKRTCVEGTIPKLFEGKMLSYIKCKSVEYVSSRVETFYDIQLNVKGKKTIQESFDDYVAVETLEGDNKYDAGDHGLQEAEKGVKFVKFPPVLHLQLMRFQYDPMTDANIKINDRFEFPDELDLDCYLQNKEDTPALYKLHAVLVHSGDNHGGHYVGYIDPRGDGKWCKFDDDVVSRCTSKEAMDRNYGGYDDDISSKHSTNAYMLVYIRKNELDNVLEPIDQSALPESLRNKLEEDKLVEAQKRKERIEAHLYMTVNVITEEFFYNHCGHDLFDPDKSQDKVRPFRVKKADTVSSVMITLSEALNHRSEAMRLWPFQMRQNHTYRPTLLDVDPCDFGTKTIQEAADSENPWHAFVETLPAESIRTALPAFHPKTDVCLFVKCYDPKRKMLSYIGHNYFSITVTVRELVPKLAEMANYPVNTRLCLYEEVKPNMIEIIELSDRSLEKELDELMDGDIIIVQKAEPNYEQYELPSPKDFSRELYHRIEVHFCDKNNAIDPGFTLELSLKMNYDQIAKNVAAHLGTDPYMLQFFRTLGYKEGAGTPIKCTFDGQLRDIVSNPRNGPRIPRKLYYQKLSIPINELENKRQFKCVWVTDRLKDEKELVLHPNKDGAVQDLLDEAIKQVDINPAGSGKLRLLEIAGYKIVTVFANDMLLEDINMSGPNKTLRIEEVPLDELNLTHTELVVPVAHFHQEIYSTFGVPFLVRVRDGEAFSELKERIRKKLDVPDKEYEKYKYAIMIMGKKTYLEVDQDFTIRTDDFRHTGSGPLSSRPWLGLDHVNKTPKRGRQAYLEKAIKIHN